MSSTITLIKRNQEFSNGFDSADLPTLPKLRTIIVACADSRVDPAHVFGLELGDAVVIRNTGGRVTHEVLNEIAALAFMAAKMDGDKPGTFELVLLQHTQCGAERFANPEFQRVLRERIGVDVSSSAITNHEESLREDIERLSNAKEIPEYVIISGYIYNVKDGSIREVIKPSAKHLRRELGQR